MGYETDRLTVRQLEIGDASFILELLNEPGWLRFIGDRGVRTEADAARYILEGPIASHSRHGFGLDLVSLKDGEPIGICGLLQRETLDAPDLGFAYLDRASGSGYATEAGRGALSAASRDLGIRLVLAITAPSNEASIRVLEKLGFGFVEQRVLAEGADPVRVFERVPDRPSGIS